MRRIIIDFETRSEINIQKCGTWRYAMDKTTDVLCLAIGLQENQKTTLVPFGKFNSPAIKHHISRLLEKDFVLVAHNSAFEYAVWNMILHRRYGWPKALEPKHWDCTMARAAACNLPLSLDKVGLAIKLKNLKMTVVGQMAMYKLCKPMTAAQQEKQGKKFCDDPKVFKDLYAYCRQDVVAEMELDRVLPQLPLIERRTFEADLVMNRRGVKVDVLAAKNAMDFASQFTEEYNAELVELTNGAVEKATRVAAMKKWLISAGVEAWKVESLDKVNVTSLLEDKEVPEKAKEVLRLRRKVGKSSTAKYKAIVSSAGYKDRIRGTLQYHAAGTGRWGGRILQPQNLPQGTLDEVQTGLAIKIMRRDCLEVFRNNFENPMEALSSCIRGMIIPEEGKDFLVADYASIEARVLLWLADDAFALNKYRMGVDIYKDMARAIYGKSRDYTVKKEERDLGKRAILGCGYGMGWKKFKITCANYGSPISDELAQLTVKTYRAKYKSVVQMWYAQERTAIKAIQNLGSMFECGKISWSYDGNFLMCHLPAGRCLRYYKPAIREITTEWGSVKPEIHFMGEDSVSHKFQEKKTYGGSIVENITQAIARDIMVNAILLCEERGYPIVLTVHDELVAEVPAISDSGEGKTLEGFIETICDLPNWAKGCPITAEGWRGKRYRK